MLLRISVFNAQVDQLGLTRFTLYLRLYIFIFHLFIFYMHFLVS